MHDLNDPTVFFEEIKAGGGLRKFFFGIVLQNLIYFKAQRKDYLLLFAKLKVGTLVI